MTPREGGAPPTSQASHDRDSHIVDNYRLIQLVCDTLSRVDPRLMAHGTRVAYIAWKMYDQLPEKASLPLENVILLALLHDIGAYKTEEIDRMVEFESGDVWEHSVYGYLFVKHLSALHGVSDVLLFHHHPELENAGDAHRNRHRDIARLLLFADRIDVLWLHNGTQDCRQTVADLRHETLPADLTQAFSRADADCGLLCALEDGRYAAELDAVFRRMQFTVLQKQKLLEMMAYAIDFRSEHMVLHTATTVSVARALGERLGLCAQQLERLHYGTLLHDIGKVTTPLEILEKPGRLTPAEMDVMREHVVHSRAILTDKLPPDIVEIACRHHEKLDGSGYPQGLSGKSLDLSQRIAAVADIVSALIRKRSYKVEYDSDRVRGILQRMMDAGQLCPRVTQMMLDEYAPILAESQTACDETMRVYRSIRAEYMDILHTLAARGLLQDAHNKLPQVTA